jgi:histidinol-phosphate aminotransferase
MNDPLQFIKPAVRALKAYTLTPRVTPVKVDQNENPFELPQEIKERVAALVLKRPWGRYPDFDPAELRTALARHSGWKADGILAGNGSNEMIEALLLSTVGEGTEVIIPEPTFTLYALMTTVIGGRPIRVPLKANFDYDIEALCRARRESAAPITVVCTPNNPTGNLLAPGDVERLCAAAGGLVVIDEAYHEFAGVSAVPLLAAHPNLVVLRTFSKALGMAGLRLGYLLAAPELVREINKARLPYNINFLTQAAALAALEDYAPLAANVKRLVALRGELLTALRGLRGVVAYPSHANFILLECQSVSPQVAFDSLLARGILVRDVSSYPRLGRCLRLSVGTEAENRAVIEALRACLETQEVA